MKQARSFKKYSKELGRNVLQKSECSKEHGKSMQTKRKRTNARKGLLKPNKELVKRVCNKSCLALGTMYKKVARKQAKCMHEKQQRTMQEGMQEVQPGTMQNVGKKVARK